MPQEGQYFMRVHKGVNGLQCEEVAAIQYNILHRLCMLILLNKPSHAETKTRRIRKLILSFSHASSDCQAKEVMGQKGRSVPVF